MGDNNRFISVSKTLKTQKNSLTKKMASLYFLIEISFNYTDDPLNRGNHMVQKTYNTAEPRSKILLLGINAPYNKTTDINAYFEEFINLATSNNLHPTEIMLINLRSIDPAYFLTKGKLDELKIACDKHNIDEVIVSEALTAQQERNLQDFLQCRVFDRTQLILEIFEKAAHSAEGKTQVAIAMLQHKKSRVAGKGIHLSQQTGIIGLRGGPGETAKEKEIRHIEEHIKKLKKQLITIEKARTTQRKRRVSSPLPLMCLIGYTNAGKSSILNALTKSNVYAEDKLFATLDTTTRGLFLNGQKKGLISDTVGFIQQLPHHLIEAFKSTLSELQYADLLLLVVDLADANWEPHIKIVHDILEDLNLHKEILYIFNKIDKVTITPELLHALEPYQPHVLISTRTKEGTLPLKEFLVSWQPSKKT